MRAIYEAVRLPEQSSFKCWHGLGRSFSTPWHFHPEVEILFIEQSTGLRFVGDSIAPFREGDLVLVGPNLPHVWLNDNPRGPLGHARAYAAQFREDFLGPMLWHAPELAPIVALLRRSRQGVRFTGPAVRRAGEIMRRMCRARGVSRLTLLFALLDLLARARRQTLLSSAGHVPNLNRTDAVRINAACRYVQENLAGEIWREQAAAAAKLSPEAFSRFFRQKMGCTFAAYVNQLRISRAIHLMVDQEMTVSEACFASGFNNLSNFNSHFRTIKGMNPRTYLAQLQRAKSSQLAEGSKNAAADGPE